MEGSMLDRVLHFFISAFLAVVGAALMQLASPTVTEFIGTEILKMDMGLFRLTLTNLLCILFGAALGGILGHLTAPFFIAHLKRLTNWVEMQLNKLPIHDVIAGAAGLAIGLIIAALLGTAFSSIPLVGSYIPAVFSIVFGYLGIHITIKKRKEIAGLFEFIPRLIKEYGKGQREAAEAAAEAVAASAAEAAAEAVAEAAAEAAAAAVPQAQPAMPDPVVVEKAVQNQLYKLLDTSVIIDGRIADICRTGFIEGTLLIPVFVLEELQHIADSADALKRVRGRRGLDILKLIRSESCMKVEIDNRDFEDIAEVDSKLVRLAQLVGGKIITNDFNLNKVAELRGVPVLNINELANAVKPVVIPGESMHVTVVKEGKEQGQGLAYLDDGTMIVIEGGRKHINSTIEVEVTSALQTAAGRMIFAKPRRFKEA